MAFVAWPPRTHVAKRHTGFVTVDGKGWLPWPFWLKSHLCHKTCFAVAPRMSAAAKVAQRWSGRQAGNMAATRWQPISKSFDSSSEVVDFGKHRGLTFAETLQKDKQYCQWVVSVKANEQRSPTMSKFITFLKAAGVEPEPLPETITFGTYSGKSCGEVFRQDPTYCEWVLHNSKDDTPSGRFAEWIRARHPQFASKVDRSK